MKVSSPDGAGRLPSPSGQPSLSRRLRGSLALSRLAPPRETGVRLLRVERCNRGGCSLPRGSGIEAIGEDRPDDPGALCVATPGFPGADRASPLDAARSPRRRRPFELRDDARLVPRSISGRSPRVRARCAARARQRRSGAAASSVTTGRPNGSSVTSPRTRIQQRDRSRGAAEPGGQVPQQHALRHQATVTFCRVLPGCFRASWHDGAGHHRRGRPVAGCSSATPHPAQRTSGGSASPDI